ncbi:MAG: FecR domain-containing protein [bacterium]
MSKNEAENPTIKTPTQREAEASLDEGEAIRLAAEWHLAERLRPLTEATLKDHLTLQALQRLANEHRRNDGEKDLPEHLTACPICLDLFQTLLEGTPLVSRRAMKRFEETPGAPRRWTKLAWFTSSPILLRAAALAAIFLGAGVLVRPLLFSNPPVTTQGVFTLANGSTVPAGQAVPARREFTMNAGAAMVLDDGGTAVRAETASNLSFSRSLRGNPRFAVHSGDVWVTAAKQKPGSTIVVQTPLGEIRVIGTKFRVTVEKEKVVVHETRPERPEVTKYATNISAVVVAVQEGTVSVRTRSEQASVSVGQTAIMRQNQQWIEVR